VSTLYQDRRGCVRERHSGVPRFREVGHERRAKVWRILPDGTRAYPEVATKPLRWWGPGEPGTRAAVWATLCARCGREISERKLYAPSRLWAVVFCCLCLQHDPRGCNALRAATGIDLPDQWRSPQEDPGKLIDWAKAAREVIAAGGRVAHRAPARRWEPNECRLSPRRRKAGIYVWDVRVGVTSTREKRDRRERGLSEEQEAKAA
jgi:hypothetical protein